MELGLQLLKLDIHGICNRAWVLDQFKLPPLKQIRPQDPKRLDCLRKRDHLTMRAPALELA